MSEIKRKLASIRKISDILPIENADLLELAVVDGWNVVVQKGKHKVGDYVVYFEIDSFLPIKPEFEFLRKSSYRNVEGLGEGFRIKTMKLRGQVSQGLIMGCEEVNVEHKDLNEDLSEKIGVIKYDPPANASALGADHAGLFPYFIPKTDQERIQNCFKEIAKNEFYEVSMKLDGTSMTVFFNEGKFGVCSRNYELKDGENAYWSVAKKLELDKNLEMLGVNLAIQGELMGPGIQKNREGLKEHTFFVFDVYIIDKREYMPPAMRRSFIEDLGINHVPIIDIAANPEESVGAFLEKADIKSINHPIAEGLVYKNILDPSKSFKVINNKFLLKCED